MVMVSPLWLGWNQRRNADFNPVTKVISALWWKLCLPSDEGDICQWRNTIWHVYWNMRWIRKGNYGGLATSQGYMFQQRRLKRAQWKEKEEAVDRRREMKTILRSEQERTLPAQLNKDSWKQERWKGIVPKPSVVLQELARLRDRIE